MTMDEHSETQFEFERLRSERTPSIESWTYTPRGDDPDEDKLVQEYEKVYNFVALETSRCFQQILDGEYEAGDEIVIVDITHLVKQNENRVLPIRARDQMGHIGFYMSPKGGRGGYSNKIIGRTKTPPSPKGGRYYWGTIYRGIWGITDEHDEHREYMESIVKLLEKKGEEPYRSKMDPYILGSKISSNAETATRRPLVKTNGTITATGDNELPTKRTQIKVNRTLRDTVLTLRIKELYRGRCLICDETIELKNGSYSEAAHIKPLGRAHNGPDSYSNVIVLCPNHHVEFDYGMVTMEMVDPKTLKVVHRDEKNPFNGRRVVLRHELNKAHLEYHYREIFNKQ